MRTPSESLTRSPARACFMRARAGLTSRSRVLAASVLCGVLAGLGPLVPWRERGRSAARGRAARESSHKKSGKKETSKMMSKALANWGRGGGTLQSQRPCAMRASCVAVRVSSGRLDRPGGRLGLRRTTGSQRERENP
jgi:hypothetical protein